MFVMEHPERVTSLTANPKNTNQFITSYDGTESQNLFIWIVIRTQLLHVDTASLWSIDDQVPNEPFQSETVNSLKKLASFPASHAIKRFAGY